jgi:hypothetical protein
LRIFKYIFLLLSLIVFFSCDEEEQVFTKEAILKWQGDYAVDGCGFFLEINKKEYKPENEDFLGDEFKTGEDISVIVKFKYSEKKITYACGWMDQLRTDGIKIISIEKI